MAKKGRPSKYTPKLAEEICTRLANGESLRTICKTPGMPERVNILRWAVTEGHPFQHQYARAREIQADSMADDILDISDDGTNDFVERETRNGKIVLADHDHINRSRLRVDARKWIAAKLLPKRYSEKVQTEISGKISLEDLVIQSSKEDPK